METNHNRMPSEENQRRMNERREGTEETDHVGSSNRDVSGHDMAEEHNEDRKHHQQFGNRKYESYRNHSAADDQPMVDTGA